MSVRCEADARLIGGILEMALPDAGVKLEPSFRIKSEDRFLIIIGSGPRLNERMSFVSVAANRGLPVIWLYDPAEGTPLQFTQTADLALEVPAPSLDMIGRTFVELYGRTPTNLADLDRPEAFTAADLALHFRLGRTPEARITSLILERLYRSDQRTLMVGWEDEIRGRTRPTQCLLFVLP